MGAEVRHIDTPTTSAFITNGNDAAVSTIRKEAFPGASEVVEGIRQAGAVALWGTDNLRPQNILADIRAYPLMNGVIALKTDLLYNGGLRYGRVRVDQQTGVEFMIPARIPAIEKFFRDTNIKLYLREASRNWYTYGNAFAQFTMAKRHRSIVQIKAQSPCFVRLGVMDDKGRITKAHVADWGNGKTEKDGFTLHTLNPDFRAAEQVMDFNGARCLYPIRELVDDEFYYGTTEWDGLRSNGWTSLAKRIPELKNLLLQNLLHIRYHIEFDEQYFRIKFKDTWAKKTEQQRIDAQQAETVAINDWLRGKGQGGAWGTFMVSDELRDGKFQQMSLVKIHDLKLATAEGAYIEDSQEVDFVTCRDMGLEPSIYGIAPSKSGSSPGSGSQGRVARTNHILNCKSHQDKITEPLYVARDVNKWGDDIEFWMAGYYAATLDRTMQVDGNPNQGKEN